MEEVEEILRTDGVIQCPYCKNEMNKGSSYDPLALPWVEDDIFESDCDECKRTFEIHASITVDHVMKAVEE